MSNSTSNVSGDAAASSSHAPLQATYALLCVCGVAANGAVICALACGGGGSKRRHVSDAYVLNLAVADLLFLLGMPFLAHQLVSEQRWRFGWFLCKALTLVDVNNQYTSVGTVTVLCIDRYIAVAHPLTAATNRTMRGAFLVNALVWLCSLLLSLPAPVYASVLRIHGVEVCALDFPEARLGATAFAVANFALAFAAPLALISVFYALALRRVSSATRRATLRPQSSRSRRATRTAVAIEECATLSRLLRSDGRNISIFKREQKAARTLGVILGAYTLCWLPFFTLSTARPFICRSLVDAVCSCVPLSLERTFLWLGYANSLVNPLIYASFNRDLRTAFRSVLRCRYRNINRRLSAEGIHEALRVAERPHFLL
ncbi:unnamed protein product [Lampetra fluviatilis]